MEWFQHIPKNLEDNVAFRYVLYEKAAKDKGLQRALKEICRQDILFWFNAICYTFDPRQKQKTIPFITYPYQDECIKLLQACINDGDHLVQPKSRTMGASWMDMLVLDHFASFERDCKFFVMSRVGDMVDDPKNKDSLFSKIDFNHKLMPSWLKPEVDRTKFNINYLETGSDINGGATVKAASVGGRSTAVLVDEFSRFEPTLAQIIKTGLGPISNCIIWPFTRSPEMGTLHPCQELVEQGKRGDIKSFPMHWTIHPIYKVGLHKIDPITKRVDIIDTEYDFSKYKFQLDGRFSYHSEWFDHYRKKNGPDQAVSANLEFDDDINDHLVYDPLMIKEYAAQHVRPPDLTGDLTYDELTGDVKEFFLKPNGLIKLWMPIDGHMKPPQINFVGAADVSLGIGTTSSCFSVARTDIGEKVLEVATPNMKPDQFAVYCVAICHWLNYGLQRTLISWESQGPGDTFGAKVRELGYYPRFKRLSARIDRYVSDKEGWSPQQNRTLHTDYERALRNRTFINHSKEALEETLQYENTPTGPKHKADRNRKNDPSGATVNHGDRTVADAQLIQLMQHLGIVGRPEEREIILPGSLAYFMRERTSQERTGKALFPGWQKKNLTRLG